jgi:DNA-binding transcriptional LysR family regulator
MTDRIKQLELFVLTAELGSISNAAEKLDISVSAASRLLAALEDRLGVQLVQRTTRKLWLSEAGHGYLLRCQALLADLREADDFAKECVSEPSGLLTITCSVSFAMVYISPVLPDFVYRYPKLNIKLITENKYYNFIESGIDVAVRTREYEPDSGITVRKVGETQRIAAASPAYLKKFGKPVSPSDLRMHRFLAYSFYADSHEPLFKRDNEHVQPKLYPTLESNDGQVLRAAATAGLGILIQSQLTLRKDLEGGNLVQILPEWHLSKMVVNVAYQSRRHLPAKVRAFVDFMIEHFE